MKKSPLYFITGNKNKFDEVKDLLPGLEHLELDLPEIQSNDSHEVIRAKIDAAMQQHTGRFIVDDTSVELDALNGFPGPFAKWMLERVSLRGIHELVSKIGNTKVAIRTIIGYSDGQSDVKFFEGSVSGNVVAPTTSEYGFGYDTIFKPNGHDQTFGQMKPEQKISLSHRTIAIKKLKRFLEEL